MYATAAMNLNSSVTKSCIVKAKKNLENKVAVFTIDQLED